MLTNLHGELAGQAQALAVKSDYSWAVSTLQLMGSIKSTSHPNAGHMGAIYMYRLEMGQA